MKKIISRDNESQHYSIFAATGHDYSIGMQVLRDLFPDAQADYMNFCLFSTSGVHGSYSTIEDAEAHILNPSDDTNSTLTFLIVHPRIVCLKYGNCEPQTADDIKFLKELRASSLLAVSLIGWPA